MRDTIFDLIQKEEKRQAETISLIPSENYASLEVREALRSVLGDKYAEGYPGKRYYQGNKVVDEIEMEVIDRCKKMFDVEEVNVQPYSGSPANTAVQFALLDHGDTICGMQLSAGGHLTHGHPKITFSGKYFHSVQYGVDREGRIDYDEMERIVRAEKPMMIFVGTTAYPFKIDWSVFSRVAEEVGAILVADISHIAGLIVGGAHESPVDHVHVITSTTHKILRGPRGAFIGVTKKGLAKDSEMAKKINRAVFPGLQGGPHENTIAAMGVAFGEAATGEYTEYIKRVVENARVMSEELRSLGLRVFGTENHLMLVEVGKEKGKEVAEELEDVGVVVNANMVPYDEGSPLRPSGIRIGSPAMTTRGMGVEEAKILAQIIARVVNNKDVSGVDKIINKICKKYPIPE